MSCRRLVFDTGPLNSFAVVGRLDLLDAVCASHATWPRDARVLAAAELGSGRVAGTTDLLARAVRLGLVGPEGAWAVRQAMLAAGRRPGRVSRDRFA